MLRETLHDGQMVFQDRGFSGWSSLTSKELAQGFEQDKNGKMLFRNITEFPILFLVSRVNNDQE